MQLWQALIIGAMQGISELFPVSSLAHTILLPALLRWDIDYENSSFLSFVVALHLATAVALLIYFWRDWLKVFKAYLGSLQQRKLVYDRESKFAWLLVAGTIAVAVFGLVLEKQLRKFFEDPKFFWLVAVFLIINGGIMVYGEFLRRKADATAEKDAEVYRANREKLVGVKLPAAEAPAPISLKNVEDLNFAQGAIVGGAQILALFPGISRSGVTIVGGLLYRLTHEEAARFSFMLATPVIGLAALLKVPDLFKPEARDILAMTIPSAILAGVSAYLSVRFLMRYFETKRLSPFGYYCIWLGLLSLIVFQVRGL